MGGKGEKWKPVYIINISETFKPVGCVPLNYIPFLIILHEGKEKNR